MYIHLLQLIIIYKYVLRHISIQIHVYIYMYLCGCIPIHLYLYSCLYLYTYICILIYLSTYLFNHICLPTYYVFIYYTHLQILFRNFKHTLRVYFWSTTSGAVEKLVFSECKTEPLGVSLCY